MPSNYTIAKALQRVGIYREICGHSAGQYPGTAMEVQFLRGQRLDELEDPSYDQLKKFLDEADAEVIKTIQELLQGEKMTVLKEDSIPLSILEITEIKGLGPKLARRAYDELGIVDLSSLSAAVEDGRLTKVKGYGQKMLEKISEFILKAEKKRKI